MAQSRQLPQKVFVLTLGNSYGGAATEDLSVGEEMSL